MRTVTGRNFSIFAICFLLQSLQFCAESVAQAPNCPNGNIEVHNGDTFCCTHFDITPQSGTECIHVLPPCVPGETKVVFDRVFFDPSSCNAGSNCDGAPNAPVFCAGGTSLVEKHYVCTVNGWQVSCTNTDFGGAEQCSSVKQDCPPKPVGPRQPPGEPYTVDVPSCRPAPPQRQYTCPVTT